MKKDSHNSTLEKGKRNINREVILKSIPGSYGVVSTISKRAKVDRKTVYSWIDKDQEIKDLFISERESLIDLAEIKLVEKVKQGNETMISLVLKTLGKRRGYVEGKVNTLDDEKIKLLKELFDNIN